MVSFANLFTFQTKIVIFMEGKTTPRCFLSESLSEGNSRCTTCLFPTLPKNPIKRFSACSDY